MENKVGNFAFVVGKRRVHSERIATSLNMKMNTISQNLKILERDNFVKFRHTSIHTFYSIKKDKKYPYNEAILKILKERLKELKSAKTKTS